MKLEIIGKKKTTLEDVDVQSQKMGQTDIKPAVCLHFKTPMPNSCLSMFSPKALEFLYQKEGPNGAKQKTLDGVAVVSEYSQLTDEANMLGALAWDGEQTGCTLYIYHGIGNKPKLTLRDCTTNKYKTTCHEGGTVDVQYRVFTTDLDAETLGELAVLKSHDLDIELTAPEAISAKQKEIDGDLGSSTEAKATGAPMSPEAAFSQVAGATKAQAAAKVVKGDKKTAASVH